MGILGAAAVGAVGAVGGGLIQANAAKSAAGTQAAAADQASNNTLAMFNTTQTNLAPFRQAGQNALGQLSGELGNLTTPFQPTTAQLQSTPGYQFTLGQGLQAAQNSFASQGLGTSGAAEKGAVNYAEGLAGTTYQQQFQNYLTQNQQIYGMLGNLGSLGENAAATTGSQGLTATGQSGAFTTAGAAASAAGTVGAANATANSLNSLGGTASNLALLSTLQQGGLFGGSGSSSNPFGSGTLASGDQG